ncbi:MAG: hypothetical protein KDC83_05870 [Flavobacteriales bacterium]|nr:hypothetical protein [Flavobacteriales bacterium]
MGCGSCSSGACGSGSIPAGCGNNGHCATGGCNKLGVFDWLAGIQLPSQTEEDRIVEVQFKNTRKEYYRFESDVTLSAGDNVVVESSHGKDVGTVTLSGELVKTQMARKGLKPNYKNLLSVERLATQEDIDLWKKSRDKEQETMVKARQITAKLKLDMKVSDVEYQGDGTKAIFYYTAEGRVDFRELIKSLASNFKVRVEMKQIGSRQEAGRVGGIGSCGRELCCSTWLTDFRSVSTTAARYQQLAINPIKLAGQCGKLKCCLNYELDSYMDALKDFPKGDVQLKTKKGLALLQKTDIFKRVMWFNFREEPSVFHPVSLDRVKEIIELNKKGSFPENLIEHETRMTKREPDYENVVGQDDLKRFDKDNKRRKNKRKSGQGNKNQQPNGNQAQKAKGPQATGQGEQKKKPNRNKNRNRNKKKNNPNNGNPSKGNPNAN